MRKGDAERTTCILFPWRRSRSRCCIFKEETVCPKRSWRNWTYFFKIKWCICVDVIRESIKQFILTFKNIAPWVFCLSHFTDKTFLPCSPPTTKRSCLERSQGQILTMFFAAIYWQIKRLWPFLSDSFFLWPSSSWGGKVPLVFVGWLVECSVNAFKLHSN